MEGIMSSEEGIKNTPRQTAISYFADAGSSAYSFTADDEKPVEYFTKLQQNCILQTGAITLVITATFMLGLYA